jgi:hypothetical protein
MGHQVKKGTYINPQYTSRYCCNYCLGEWNTCLGGQSPTSSLVTPNDKWISLSLEMVSELIDPTHIDMVYQTLMMTTHTMMMVAQEKTQSYIE